MVPYDALKERLREHAIPDANGCWIWTGFRLNSGYGQINFNKKLGPVLVHRLAYAIEHELPLEALRHKVVMHECNKPSCIRPSHLKLGTQRQNQAYMSAQGRAPRGERSGVAKLTEADVLRIRALDSEGTHTQAEIAQQFGVKGTTISAIVRRINWHHI